MSPIKITENIPRRICTDDRLKTLRKLKIKTTGYDRSMEKILLSKGFKLPQMINEESWMFQTHKYTLIYLNRADCLAEALILLKKLELI